MRIEKIVSREKIDFILNRRSCRDFFPEPLKEGDLQLLLECLRKAPSAGNLQPWFFYVVFNESKKRELAKAAYGQSFIASASVVFVVCAEPEASAKYYGNRGKTLYCIQDTAAAVENLLLSATALGYGSCWIGAFDKDKASMVLDIPGNLMPVAIVPVGYGSFTEPPTSRKPIDKTFAFIK